MSRARLGFILDLERCTGCRACELACSTENELGWGRSWRRIVTFNPAADPRAPHHHLSLACNHCADAPCAAACPARAYTREAATGVLTLEPDRCVGCRFCAWACPFEAPLFDDAAGVMGKCTFCPQRVEAGGEPACVHACPTGALTFGSLDDADADVGTRPPTAHAAGFPETTVRPAMRFRPRRAGAKAPESTWQLEPEVLAAFDAARPARPVTGGLGHEWPLLVFTLAASLAVALETAALAGRAITPWLPALLVIAGMGLSTLHLGRPARAWRALLGVGTSWLSREIALVGALAALLALGAVAPGAGQGVRDAAVAVGWAALYAMDRVYDPVRRPRALAVHSADTLFVAAWLAAALTGPVWLAASIGGLRLAFYLARKVVFAREGRPTRPLLSVLRVGLGFGLPLAASWLPRPGAAIVIAAGLAAGELIDRAELYLELEPVTPREVAASDLAAAIAGSR